VRRPKRAFGKRERSKVSPPKRQSRVATTARKTIYFSNQDEEVGEKSKSLKRGIKTG